jgi:alkylhydroperoxidase family enzyme
MSSTPTRIDDELFEHAKLVGSLMSRSAAQQIAHWAKIGREVESAEGVSARAIGEVLARRSSYDALTDEEQAIVRAEWAERIEQRRAALDITSEFAAQGRSWVELDDDGEVVERGGEPEESTAGA